MANIGQMLADTHTFHPDHFAACRHAQLEDIRDLLNAVMASYKQTMYVSGPDGSAGSVQDIEVYPGTMAIALGGHEFIGPTIAGDENEAIPISDEKVEVMRTIAKTLTRCRRNCVLLPPPGTKFGAARSLMTILFKLHGFLMNTGLSITGRPCGWNCRCISNITHWTHLTTGVCI